MKNLILGIILILITLASCKKEEIETADSINVAGTYYCTITDVNDSFFGSYYIFHSNRTATYHYIHNGRKLETNMIFTLVVKKNDKYLSLDIDPM